MGKPYSEEVRRGVVRGIESGLTYEEVADTYGVSVSSVSRFLTRFRSNGNVSPAKFGGYKRHALQRHEKQITQWIAVRPDITLSELQARLAKENASVSQAAIFRFLRHLGFTFKKKPARGRTRPTGRGRST
jgi:transposase